MNKVTIFGSKRFVAILGILVLFVFLRVYRIDRTLFFYGDMGRDLSVLFDWKQSGKPPLLGPQASAVAFTHSPVYFYTLFPVFFLTNGSEYTAIITNLVVGLLIMAVSLWLVRNDKKLLIVVILYVGLLAVFPQHIAQSRYVWNPTFVPYWMLLGLIGWWRLMSKGYAKRNALVFALGSIGALTFSYSVIPTLGLLNVALLIRLRKEFLKLLGWLVGFLVAFFAPMMAFDLRHKFFLANQLFFGHRAPQPERTVFDQLSYLVDYLGEGWVMFGLLACIVVFWTARNIRELKRYEPKVVIGVVMIFNGLFLVFSDIHLAAHYIFGLVALLLWWLAALPLKEKVLIIPLLLISWLSSDTLTKAFNEAPRSYEQILSCAQQVCQAETEPLYITAQTGYYPQHDAPEFKYVFKKAGCTVKEIDKEPVGANSMAVVVDNSTYEHGKTNFNELTQFGTSTVKQVHSCNPKLEVVVLKR